MKKKVRLNRIVLICMIFVLFLPVIERGVSNIFVYDRDNGELSVYKSIFYDYEYVFDKEGNVILDEYKGDEVNVIVPDKVWGKTVTRIGDGCFNENESVEKVVLPQSVRSIGSATFENCSGLKEVSVTGNSNISTVGHYAFNNCFNLEKISCGNKIEYIGVEAFANCGKLSTINEQPGLKTIRSNAFENSGLTELTIDSLEQLDWHAFEGTPYLKNMRKSNEEFVIVNHILFDCNSTKKIIVIPDDVTTVDCDFSDCPNVEMIVSKNVEDYNEAIFSKGKKIQLVILNSANISGLDVESDIALIWLNDCKTSQVEKFTERYGIEIMYLEVLQMQEFLKERGVSWQQ